MAVTTQKYQSAQLNSFTSYGELPSKSNHTRSILIAPIFRAALLGGLCQVTLLGLGLLPLPTFMSILMIGPTFLMVCIFTGLFAAYLAGDVINSTQKGGEVAWMAGFWAGVVVAIMAMILAANGMLLVEFGQEIILLRTPEQLELLNRFIATHTLALSGRVFGAFLLYGLIGSLISALISAFGGIVYFKYEQPSTKPIVDTLGTMGGT